MQKHPCRECREMPGGQNMQVEPCSSCPKPENYCRAIGVAGVGSVPDPVADYRVKQGGVLKPEFKQGIGEILDQAQPAGGGSPGGKEKPEDYVCKKCSKPKPRTKKYFAPHAKTADGLHTTCRSCMSAALSGRSGKKKPAGGKPGAAPRKAPPPPVSLNVDFGGHKELMKDIEAEAAASFRPLNLHVLFILHQHINHRKKGIIQ